MGNEEKQCVCAIIARYRDVPGPLLPILQGIQEEHGHLSEAAMHQVAASLGRPPGEVYSVATFYTLFSTRPRGKYVIRVCENAPCHIKGAPAVIAELEKALDIKAGETTPDGKFSLEFTSCVGICGVAPAIMVNQDVHGNLTPSSIAQVLGQYR
ncbi:MAG TPA: NADH-quinone oxidoreductase subunit NuoE [Clostridiales bacterium UBA8153]|nr:NADH-quinone oxidoreductase subunit NuoE [Clostridiales bacterium UBA8153]